MGAWIVFALELSLVAIVVTEALAIAACVGFGAYALVQVLRGKW